MHRVVIFGIDSFEKKNVNQVKVLNNAGYTVDVLTSDRYGKSRSHLPIGNEVIYLKAGLIGRFIQVTRYLLKNRLFLHHAEIYPGGRFAFIYLLLLKITGLSSIIVERGDLFYRNQIGFAAKFSLDLCYKLSDVVWYREFYPNIDVEEELHNLHAKRIVFIPNSVNVPVSTNCQEQKKYDFLWANSLKTFRYPEWFVGCLKEDEFANTRNALLGIDSTMEDPSVKKKHELVKELALDNVEIFGFIDPSRYYLTSKYFVLASDLVFLNNALLEAMSCGVVPIVSNVKGADLIVDHGKNGFLFESSQLGLLDTMKEAFSLSSRDYLTMSQNAIKKVRSEYSVEAWTKKYLALIDSVQ